MPYQKLVVQCLTIGEGIMPRRKGDWFSVTSPLSQDDKKLFLTFQGGCEDRVLSDENLNSAQREVVEAREAGRDGSSRLHAAQRRLQRLWADSRNVELYTGESDRTPPAGWPELPAWEHASIWVRGNTPLIAVSQPYPWRLNDHVERLNEFAESHGLNFRISNHPSWYYPGRCWFVEWHQSGNRAVAYDCGTWKEITDQTLRHGSPRLILNKVSPSQLMCAHSQIM